MLAQFTFKRTFNRISVTIYVDCETKTAEITIKEDRLIRSTQPIQFHEVDTPEKCRIWLNRPIRMADGELSYLEHLDRHQRKGLFPFERAA